MNINLLPWRDEEIKYQKKIVKKMLVLAALLGMAINILCHFILSQQENTLQKRIIASNEMLKKTGKINLLETDDQLPSPGKIFFVLGKKQQAMTCLTEIKSEYQLFFFKGKARSMQDLMDWKAATILSDMKFKQIKQQENGIVEFDLEIKK